jgi:UDP-N-acetylmuramoyl-tripeptide--D-alanyl-D-alanine ligase
MIRMQLADMHAHTAGECSGDVMIRGITTDSRSVRSGMLFAALPGAHADGHDFVQAAVRAGAVAILASREIDCPVPVLQVPDVLQALGEIARLWRRQVDPLVIGITGSNGKTTTKEMLHEILRRQRKVLATRGNFNNELGLPLTLFKLETTHEVAVLEMGASRAGDISYLAGIGQPQIGLVTNIGPAHLEGFGDEEGVARAKGELFAALPPNGWAVMNADEPWLELWQGMVTAGNRLLFGSTPGCDVFAEGAGNPFRICTPSGSFSLRLALPGAHNRQNALAAAAVAIAAGEHIDDIQAGLAAVQPVPGRLNLLHAPGGWNVIDDTYNANPASLYAALQVLAAEQGEPWLVLGDMAELGASSRKLHAEMGEAASALGVRRLYAIGAATAVAVDAFGPGARHFDDMDSLLRALQAELETGVTCLVKGSRSMGMERVVEAISSAGAVREAG